VNITAYAVKNSKTGNFIDSRSRKWSELPKEGFPRLFSKKGHATTWIKLADMPSGCVRDDLVVIEMSVTEVK